ncbi:hypothetical protein WJX75_001594 [Coccomyxa subellipsoidea]|uniref:Amino acid transporter n=1 Tax=Coccomyxa subellipsoidea TaxID=248742 RepID=A0ABR2Z2D4_9CHLO
MDSGEERLKALGYKQELRRDFTLVSNTAISFSIISTLLGVTGSLPLAYNNGGAPTAIWGWVLVSGMTMTVALTMAEIVSSLPSSGGPYFWATHLAPRRGKLPAFAGWLTGWFNLLGQVAITAGIDFSLTNHIACMWALGNGHILTQKELLAVYGVILAIHGIVNTISTRILAWIATFSAAWHFVGAMVLAVLIPCVAPTHQSASFVFLEFQGADVTASGITNNAYIFFVGMLMAQFTFTGYDACGHMSEETKSADKTAAWGIVLAVGLSAISGFIYIIALMFSIQDPTDLLTGSANGYVAGQIMWDAFLYRYGTGVGAMGALVIPLVAAFCCGATSVASNSRMLWSFSRDRGVPGHRLWSSVNRLTGTPINAVWAMVIFAFILGLPMLNSTVAFSAVVSISTIGLYISYAIPIAVRLFNAKDFQPGPFNLGWLGPIIATIAILWVSFITIIFVLPNVYPVTYQTLNYAPVAVGIVLFGALFAWILPCGFGAKDWFKGCRQTLDDSAHNKKEYSAEPKSV